MGALASIEELVMRFRGRSFFNNHVENPKPVKAMGEVRSLLDNATIAKVGIGDVLVVARAVAAHQNKVRGFRFHFYILSIEGKTSLLIPAEEDVWYHFDSHESGVGPGPGPSGESLAMAGRTLADTFSALLRAHETDVSPYSVEQETIVHHVGLTELALRRVLSATDASPCPAVRLRVPRNGRANCDRAASAVAYSKLSPVRVLRGMRSQKLAQALVAEGAVVNIRRQDNTIVAKVKGTQEYSVSMSFSPGP